jgi:hypothetical protein
MSVGLDFAQFGGNVCAYDCVYIYICIHIPNGVISKIVISHIVYLLEYIVQNKHTLCHGLTNTN